MGKKDKKGDSGLIECPKCHHKVSKAARTCSDCGHPIGFMGWIAESKILVGITTLVGLWLFLGDDNYISNSARKYLPQWLFPQVSEKTSEKEVSTGRLKKSKKKGKKNKGNVKYITKKSRCRRCRKSAIPGYIKCYRCKGSGKCRKCKGRGTVYKWGKRETCSECKGTGKCRVCKNSRHTGYIKCPNCRDGWITRRIEVRK